MSFVLLYWRYIVMAVLAGAAAVQTLRLDHAKVEYARLESEYGQFKATVAAMGEKAKKEAAEKEAADRKRKDDADAENAKVRRDLAGVYDAYRRLRDSRSTGGGILPSAPAGAPSAATAAFDRGRLDSALSAFDRGVTGLLEEGDRAIADLDTARRWAQSR